MIRLFSVCTPGRLLHLVVLNYFGQNISQVCSSEVSLWIVCAIFSSLSCSDLLAFLEKSESLLKAHRKKSERLLMVLTFLFVPCQALCDNFLLSVLVNLPPLPCLSSLSLLSPNPPRFGLLIVSLLLCPRFSFPSNSSHPAHASITLPPPLPLLSL